LDPLSPPSYLLLRFEIEDTGIGIPPEELPDIFVAFQQLHHKRDEGVGLGLAISQQLLHLMHSALQVESTPGRGSRFWFEVALPPIGQIEVEEGPSPRITSYRSSLDRPLKILVVDDHSNNRQILRALLAPLGFHLAEAACGSEALTQAAAMEPDLILMDLVMPGMDGYEITHRLRQQPRFQGCRIIAVSASASDQARQQSLKAGCNDYIAKPFEVDVLLERLRLQLPLVWVYEGQAEAFPPPSFPLPPAEELVALRELVMNGDIFGVQEQAQRLVALDPNLEPFITVVERLARQFRLKQLQRFLEQQLETL
jgi:CheY-like chemotaxis protein